ncbi:putative 4-alpha-glucanotransferase malQ [Mycobacterium xenopi 3993]|nr:putative 4-alpha-glucanotransferase malQ [Mycobacterium xenopi 3993]
MPEPAPSLVELAEKFGIATEYEDWAGRHIAIPEETLVAVLGAFGVAAATEQERRAALDADHRAYWARALPPTIVARAGAPTTIWAHVSHGDPAEVWLQLEDGTVRSDLRQVDNFTAPFDLDGCLIGEASFVLPSDLPLGYHRLHLRSGERDADTAVIVTPNRLGIPERLGHSRSWGLATQLYSVRSQNSWASAISAISPTWPCGRRHSTARATCWSTRCMRPRRPHRWSPRRTCRRRGVSSTRFTFESRRSRNSHTCASAAESGGCVTRPSSGPTNPG